MESARLPPRAIIVLQDARRAERRRYNSYIRVAKRSAKQIECDGGPVPAWPSLGYLYSYRCIGKVGSLLASVTALFSVPSQDRQHASLHLSTTVINTKNSCSQPARGRFIAYELSDLSIACRSPPPPFASSRLLGRFLASVRYCERLFQGTNPVNHPTDCDTVDTRNRWE